MRCLASLGRRAPSGRAGRAGALLALVVLASCSASPDVAVVDRAELQRRLRLAADQLRVDLRDSAAAELAVAARMAPMDPGVLLLRARLELLGAGPGRSGEARRLLEEAVRMEPAHLPARRLLYELLRAAGNDREADAERVAIEGRLGPLGALELQLVDAAAGRKPLSAAEPRTVPGPPETLEGFAAFQEGIRLLQREGHYAPDQAVPAIEGLFARFPELAALRLLYTRVLLDKQIRVTAATRAGLPPLSPRTTAEFAGHHLERVVDAMHPESRLCQESWLRLADVATRLGDWEQAGRLADALAQRAGVDPSLRYAALAIKGVALYRNDRFAEAVPLLEGLLKEPFPVPPAYQGLPAAERERFVAWSRLPARWILRLAYRGLGQAPPSGSNALALRNGLAAGPSGEPPLVDIAARLGIDKLDGLGPSAWADYDQDGDLDLFVTGCDSYAALFRNDGERFNDASVAAGLFEAQSGFSATFVDPDNDGWPDIHVGRDGWNGPAKNALYQNQRDGRFVEITDASGLGDRGSTFVHHWLDYDRDGLIDLYLANGITGAGDTNRLYHNEGDGTFRDATERAGLAEPAGTKTIGIAIGDYDADGWPDIFVSGFQMLNRLYRNRGDGSFEELAGRLGVDGRDHISIGYVSFFMDHDLDGRLDILRTSLAPWNEVLVALSSLWDSTPDALKLELARHAPKLYRNRPEGGFEDISLRSGLLHPVGVMGANVADIDNDGFEDIYFGTGDPKIERLEPDRFYRNRGDGVFEDATFAYGLGHVGKGHGISIVDWDRDGRLEIYAQEGGFEHGDQWRNAFYHNRLAAGHWLQLSLSGRESNRDAIGARVVAVVGKRRIVRERHGGHGFGSMDMPELAFGLGTAPRIDVLEVYWPSGRRQSFRGVAADRRLELVEGETLREVVGATGLPAPG